MAVTPTDLGIYLAHPNIDLVRAQLILDQASMLCESVLLPLPDGSDAVVLDVAARAYTNPANVQQQTVGPYSAGYGPVSGGLWLTKQNKATLRRLGGGGGAFTIDVTPTGALSGLPWWDQNTQATDATAFDQIT